MNISRPRRSRPRRRSIRIAISPMPSASSRSTPSRRRSPAIPACRWAWPTSRPCCSRASSSSTPRDPDWPDRDRFVLSAGPRLDAALCAAASHRLATACRSTRSRRSGNGARRRRAIRNTATRRASRRRPGRSGRGSRPRSAWRSPSAWPMRGYGDGLVDHYTYVIAGDGCLMEGISQEAISLAGHLGLGRLIVLFDDNGISIDGPTSLATSDDQLARFAASGWSVRRVDGHDPEAVAAAIAEERETRKPSLIACRTIIGFGAPDRQGTREGAWRAARHRETAAARANARLADYPPFVVPERDPRGMARRSGSAGGRASRPGSSAAAGATAAQRDLFIDGQGRCPAGRLCRRPRAETARALCRDERPKLATRQASQQVLDAHRPAQFPSCRRLGRPHAFEPDQGQGADAGHAAARSPAATSTTASASTAWPRR